MPILEMTGELEQRLGSTSEVASWKATLEKPLIEVLKPEQLQRFEELTKKEREVQKSETELNKLRLEPSLSRQNLQRMRELKRFIQTFSREEQEELNILSHRGLQPWQVRRVELAQKPIPSEVQETIDLSRDYVRVKRNYDIPSGPYFYPPKSKISE